ncbi:hypothetical protein U1Q18_051566 [Sarracenia purpurea var. burkii]
MGHTEIQRVTAVVDRDTKIKKKRRKKSSHGNTWLYELTGSDQHHRAIDVLETNRGRPNRDSAHEDGGDPMENQKHQGKREGDVSPQSGEDRNRSGERLAGVSREAGISRNVRPWRLRK